MGSSRKSYAQLEAEIQALIKKREAVIEDSAEILRKAILTKEVKNRIAAEPTDIIKTVGKRIAESINKYIDDAKKQADVQDVQKQQGNIDQCRCKCCLSDHKGRRIQKSSDQRKRKSHKTQCSLN